MGCSVLCSQSYSVSQYIAWHRVPYLESWQGEGPAVPPPTPTRRLRPDGLGVRADGSLAPPEPGERVVDRHERLLHLLVGGLHRSQRSHRYHSGRLGRCRRAGSLNRSEWTITGYAPRSECAKKPSHSKPTSTRRRRARRAQRRLREPRPHRRRSRRAELRAARSRRAARREHRHAARHAAPQPSRRMREE